MIVHVYERAEASGEGPVWVATDDREIADVVEAAGGKAVMTDATHPSGSDRIWQALGSIDGDGKYDTVINVQGDVPTIEPELLTVVAEPLKQAHVDIATLACEIDNDDDKSNPAIVKPVIAWQDDTHGKALYFSRACIPGGEGPLFHHIGIYAYRRSALEKFVSLPPSPLELRERLEQLRALEAGMHIDVVRVNTVPLGVDTPEQLEQARSHFS